jgi:hypothetical protein
VFDWCGLVQEMDSWWRNWRGLVFGQCSAVT